jgi:DNA repair protein RadC
MRRDLKSPVPFIRLVREPNPTGMKPVPIRDPEGAIDFLRPLLEREEVEVFLVLILDSGSRIRAAVPVSRGLLNASLVHPREVFRVAIMWGAAGIILAHNHPSGDPTPSPEDRAVTHQLVEAGRLLDIPVYDHLIIGGATDGETPRHVSMVALGLL